MNNKNKIPHYSAVREFIPAALFCIRITLCCDLMEQLYIMPMSIDLIKSPPGPHECAGKNNCSDKASCYYLNSTI